MLVRPDDMATTTANWLRRFEHALAECDEILLNALFHRDSHWRDVLALTWRIRTINGGNTIASELREHGHLRPAGFKLAPGRTAPRHVTRAGVKSIEAIFRFETTESPPGSGVFGLTPDPDSGDTLGAWTLLTALDEIKGHEERIGAARPMR